MAVRMASGANFFRLASWNARALLCVDRKKRTKKLQYLRQLLHRSDVVAVQEAHGYVELIHNDLADVSKLFLWLHSIPDSGSGGLLFAIRKTFSSTSVLHETVPGRVAYAAINTTFGTLNVINVHNYGTSESQMAVVERTIRSLIDDGIARYKEVMTLLAGDMNFLDPGEHRLLIEKPRDLLHAHNDHSFHDAMWGRIFEGMVELQQQSHTHYDHASLSLSRIDRLYMAAGSSQTWCGRRQSCASHSYSLTKVYLTMLPFSSC